jgi:hypothetical protein
VLKPAYCTLAGLAILLLFAGCGRSPEGVAPSPGNSPAPSAAAATVDGFFSSYRGNFREADPARLSQGLAAAVQSAIDGEKESAARVKASEFPNDKPAILEGEVFTGLYEGFTGYEILGESVAGDQAVVQVRFRNEPYNVTWTDEVVLVDEDGWKIDDIRYAQKMAGLLGLREVLQEFERAVAAEAASMAKKQ